jgi:hypothetical protein
MGADAQLEFVPAGIVIPVKLLRKVFHFFIARLLKNLDHDERYANKWGFTILFIGVWQNFQHRFIVPKICEDLQELDTGEGYVVTKNQSMVLEGSRAIKMVDGNIALSFSNMDIMQEIADHFELMLSVGTANGRVVRDDIDFVSAYAAAKALGISVSYEVFVALTEGGQIGHFSCNLPDNGARWEAAMSVYSTEVQVSLRGPAVSRHVLQNALDRWRLALN